MHTEARKQTFPSRLLYTDLVCDDASQQHQTGNQDGFLIVLSNDQCQRISPVGHDQIEHDRPKISMLIAAGAVDDEGVDVAQNQACIP